MSYTHLTLTERFDEYREKKVLAVECKAGKAPVFVKDGAVERFFLRAGASTQELGPSQMNEVCEAAVLKTSLTLRAAMVLPGLEKKGRKVVDSLLRGQNPAGPSRPDPNRIHYSRQRGEPVREPSALEGGGGEWISMKVARF